MNPSPPAPESSDAQFSASSVSMARPVIGTAIVGVLGTAVGTALEGMPGFIAGLLGTVIVLAFFGLGQLAVGRVLRNNPALGLNVALGVYLGQVVVLFILLSVLKNATFFNPRVFAGVIVATALTWTVLVVMALSKRRVLYVEPESTLGLSDDPEVVQRPTGEVR